MDLRVTTGGTLRMYRSDLMRSTSRLNAARDTVLTQRNFNSYAEDPSAATMSFKLRRQFSTVSDQAANVDVQSKRFQSAYTALNTTKGYIETASQQSTLYALNDPTGNGRQPLAQELNSLAESIVQTMNTTYSDNFVFGGNDADTAPFSWDATTGDLLFRGVSMNIGNSAPFDAAGNPQGVQLPAGTPPPTSQVASGSPWDLYYTAYPDYGLMVDMTYESAYVDIGSGLSFNPDGTVNSATAFNTTLNGASFLNFGYDAEGDPKNVVSLIKEISDIYARTDPDTGDYAVIPDDQDNAIRLSQKLQDALAEFTNSWVDMDGKAAHLKATATRLADDAYTINEQFLQIEQVDMADAITAFSWAQYCYNAALQVGSDILSQSLIDYMN